MFILSDLTVKKVVKAVAMCGVMVMGISVMAKAGPDEPPPAIYVLPQNPAAELPPPPPPPPSVPNDTGGHECPPPPCPPPPCPPPPCPPPPCGLNIPGFTGGIPGISAGH